MRKIGAHIGHTIHYFILEWFTFWIELIQDELVKTLLRQIIATKQVKELISNLLLAVQLLYAETYEMVHAQGTFNLVCNLIYDPRRASIDFIY